jgi:drug/metabolite transporter (DMT)-like permease
MPRVGATFAVLAALAFAVGSVLQQRGTLSTDAPEGDPRFLVQTIRKPVWLAGAGCQACGWVLQAVALDHGSLVAVQSLCALSLVFALPLGAWLTDQHVGPRSIVGAVSTLAGIVVIVVGGQPAGGSDRPSARAWWVATALALGVMAVLGAAARRRRGPLAATLFAAAAGLAFGYQAAVTKVFVGDLGHGLSGVLSSWTTYALIASALAGFALQQSALKTGHLAPALAASNASTLVSSVVLGVLIFEEHLSASDGGRGWMTVGGLAVAVTGIILLSVDPADGRRAYHPSRVTPVEE